ncbi:MAG TPA: dual specificity protein phosphatase family protein [Caldilineae bacterium]|nr:dual specificity protein phosphatase family protein [Caldilineae bacterium]
MDVSPITESLYIAANPRADVVESIQQLGVRMVISMIAIRPTRAFFRRPFKLLILPTADDPRLPIPLFALKYGVKRALPVIEQGDGVLVYCREGRHRSVAMAACILIGLGYTADDAMALITAKREVADPHAPHIEKQIRKYERWREEHRRKENST